MQLSIYGLYKKLVALPFGNHLFNLSIGLKAPFFGKIRPKVLELRPAYCKIRMADRWSVRNHIGTVNAGAFCTLAEITGGMALDAAVPTTLRWIPRSMTVSYIAKGIGTLHAISEFDTTEIGVGDMVVPVVVKNAKEETVFTADITFYVSEKKPK